MARASRPREVRAAALNADGLRHKAAGRYVKARGCYLRALRLVGGLAGRDRDAVATLCHNLGGIEHARGSYRAAEVWARRGLRIRTRLPDLDPVAVAADRAALAAILDGLQRYEEAERLYRGALQTYENPMTPSPLEVVHVLGNLGAQSALRGRWQEAVELLEESARRKRRLPGAPHPDLGVTLHNLAVALGKIGEPEEAATAAAEALVILRGTLGADHPWTEACLRLARRPTEVALPGSVASPGRPATAHGTRAPLSA